MQRLRLTGKIRRPSAEEVRQLAATEYMHLTPEEAAEMAGIIDRSLALFDHLDELPQPRRAIKYTDRNPGYRPTPEEDPFNIFVTKCYVKGATQGKLAGKRVGLKDNLCLAGVPMSGGSIVATGFIPDIDATVVERLLDAGAVIVGKLNMDDFAFAGTGETSALGCIRNPLAPEHSAGGSSSGSGAALASGDVDIALGVDEGGSGRIPAAWCGVVSIKPTHGLVPSFGQIYMDHTLDFICPMARSVNEVALTLEVIAGDDPRDPQWVRGPIRVEEYSQALNKGVSGLKIGLVKEAFGWSVSEPEVDQVVRQTVARLGELGASTSEVSLPWFREARAIWVTLTAHSASAMMESDLEGYWRMGHCNLSWQEAFGRARRVRSDDLPPMLKMVMVEGKYMRREYYSTYYSKAQNLRMVFRDQVSQLLEEVDVLAMPTAPMRPVKLGERAGLQEMAARATIMSRNTMPFNLTGHPALSIPCGRGDTRTIGLQLVGRHWDESTLFRVASAWEQHGLRGG